MVTLRMGARTKEGKGGGGRRGEKKSYFNFQILLKSINTE